ncbi:MAG: hypothetical protein IJS89_03615 [Bacteroidaceae bacterium]|nr:hypothetical protein [Bacteroidaceae bacterium]
MKTKKNYIQPDLRTLALVAEPLLAASDESKRGYAVDNEEADDSKIINVEKQTDFFSLELD